MEQNRTVKVLFNPKSGVNRIFRPQLETILAELQRNRFIPEVYCVEKGRDFSDVIRDALIRGIRLFAACGGDGTVSAVAGALAGKNATLAVIPTGTRNNIACSLGIPEKPCEAADLLNTGRKMQIDTGALTCCGSIVSFLEVCSIGLFSAVFSACDELQHGNLSRIGDFLSRYAEARSSKFRFVLDRENEITVSGSLILIANMPNVIRRFQVGKPDAFCDGLMDILIFDDIPKQDLIKLGITGPHVKAAEDPRIHHFQAKYAEISTYPEMPVMADGNVLGKDSQIKIEMRSRSLSVMLPPCRKEKGRPTQ